MSKKVAAGVVLIVVMFVLVNAGLAAEQVKIFVDGKEISTDFPPQTIGGRVMVPLRAVAEAFGAKVEWVGNSNSVVITTNRDNSLKLLKLDGEATTWPYWYENGILYMEWRNALEVARMCNPHCYYALHYYPDSNRMVRNNKFSAIPWVMKGDFKVLSMNKLKEEQFVNYQWDAEHENLTLYPIN